MPLDLLLSDLSALTWRFLGDARLAGWDPREETITEQLLVEMWRHAAAETRVYKVTTKEESEYGPDWLWSFGRGNRWLTLWVQAKKASGSDVLSYRGLAGDKGKAQCLRLLLNAHEHNAVPTYAFYNPRSAPFDDGAILGMGGCRRGYVLNGAGLPWVGVHPAGPGAAKLIGCSRTGVVLADAFDVAARSVFSAHPGAQHAVAVNEYGLPWECLVCPTWAKVPTQPAGADEPPDGPGTPFRNTLSPAMISFSLSDDASSQLVRGVTRTAPEWVIRLQETNSPFRQDSIAPEQLALPDYYVVTTASDGA
jgi:hypothetical protein